MIAGKNSKYKLFWNGNESGTGGVGILLAKKWIEKVSEVTRVSDRILLLKVLIGESILHIVSIYVPQIGLTVAEKDKFYEALQTTVSGIPEKDFLLPCGDWNGHIGRLSDGFEGVHGGYAFGSRNSEGERVLEFAVANDLVIGNSYFQKKDNHLVTYESGGSQSQIDFILCRKGHFKYIQNVKVIPGEECAPQHKLLVADLRIRTPVTRPTEFTSKCRSWKLRDPTYQEAFKSDFSSKVHGKAPSMQNQSVEEIWGTLKSSLQEAANNTCGMSKKGVRRKETWWWNEEVNDAVVMKRRAWKAWKQGGSKAAYLNLKRTAKHVVYQAKRAAEDAKFKDLDGKTSDVFRIAKRMKQENSDVTGEKCVRNDEGEMALSDEAKKLAWKQHYENLLNVEFAWDRDTLSDAQPVEGPSVYITSEMVSEAIKKMKIGKAPGPSGIVAEMLKASGEDGIDIITHLVNAIIKEDVIPMDWEESYIINLFKGKGDGLLRGNYRGLKLLEQVMKVMERILEKLIRDKINIDEMQFGFMPGRGTTDAIFILRQMQEKHIAKNKKLYIAFVDLEKAFDRVPREVVWWAMRKLGVDEWIIKLVQAMYVNARSRVRVNSSYSDAFGVNVGVHQGSVLSPLLFIMVLEALSREFRTGCPWELFYADDLVIIAESMEELIERLKEWKMRFSEKGLNVNIGKTKVMISGRNLNTLKKTGKYPCGVCFTGVGRNSIYCSFCSCWVHKKCTNIHGPLINVANFKCARCSGSARPIDVRPFLEITLDGEVVEAVDCFCYLGDMIAGGGGCHHATTARIRSAWGKFRELLPLLTSRSLLLSTRGYLYDTCVRSVMTYGCECWAPTVQDTLRIQRNDRIMVRWICNVKLEDHITSDSLLHRLGIASVKNIMQRNRLRWYGHVQRSTGWIKRVTEYVVEGGNQREEDQRKTGKRL